MQFVGKESTTTEITWHDISENIESVPKSGIWFICKVKDSDDLKLICGFENVTPEHCDAWAEINCPY